MASCSKITFNKLFDVFSSSQCKAAYRRLRKSWIPGRSSYASSPGMTGFIVKFGSKMIPRTH
jgi:hypothetical protein